MATAVCPGSFDPVTLGHIDIVRRASKMFDHVIVAVMTNPEKRPSFTAEERVALLKIALRDVPNVEIDCFNGLLADYTRVKKAAAIVINEFRSGALGRISLEAPTEEKTDGTQNAEG